MEWKIKFTKQAKKDAKKLAQTGLRSNAEKLLKIISKDPYQTPPPFKKLKGELCPFFSRRINIQHRLVYEIYADIKTIKVLRMWSHYE